ncbi:hypothetical protein L1887_55788 [Cichorium endivia]|nr:hypothetical protein L1887_55788 [Cichorium endivia]
MAAVGASYEISSIGNRCKGVFTRAESLARLSDSLTTLNAALTGDAQRCMECWRGRGPNCRIPLFLQKLFRTDGSPSSELRYAPIRRVGTESGPPTNRLNCRPSPRRPQMRVCNAAASGEQARSAGSIEHPLAGCSCIRFKTSAVSADAAPMLAPPRCFHLSSTVGAWLLVFMQIPKALAVPPERRILALPATGLSSQEKGPPPKPQSANGACLAAERGAAIHTMTPL